MSRSKRGEVQENTVFTVTYLGADNCRALRGEDVTEPVVKSFIYGDSEEGDTGKKKAIGARTVVMDVGQKEISMTELVTKKNKVSFFPSMSCIVHCVDVLRAKVHRANVKQLVEDVKSEWEFHLG
jgi:carbamoylphosphate synthase small subunit